MRKQQEKGVIGLRVQTLCKVFLFSAAFVIVTAISLTVISSKVLAQTSPQGMTIQGRVLTPSGQTLEAASVLFTVQVRSSGAEDCLLYEETHTLNMTGSEGIFSFGLGSGTRSGSAFKDSSTLTQVFSNASSVMSGLTCVTGTTYLPVSGQKRKLRLSFDDGSGPQLVAQALDIQAVPYALYADSVQGKVPADFIQKNTATAALTQTNLESVFQNNTYVTELQSLIAGNSAQYQKANQLNGQNLPTLGNGQAMRWNAGTWEAYAPLTSFAETDPSVQSFAKSGLPVCSTNEFLKDNGSGALVCSAVSGSAGGTVTSIAAGAGLTGGTITSTGTLALSDVGTAGTYVKVTTDAKGRISSGQATLLESDIPTLSAAGKVSGSSITSGTIAGSTSINTSGSLTAASAGVTSVTTQSVAVFEATNSKKVTLRSPGALATDYTLTFPAAVGGNGQVLSTDASGNLSWVDRLTGTVQSLVAGTGISVSGTSTVTVSATAASTSAPGIVQLAADSESSASKAPKADDPRLSNARTPSGTASGDLSGAYPGPTVAKIQGNAVSATAPTLTGQILRWNQSGTQWVANFLSLADIRSDVIPGNTMFPATSCTAAQALTWSSLTDTMTCANIAISNTAVSGLGTAATLNVGTGNNNIVQLNGTAKIPAVDGSLLTNLNASSIASGTVPSGNIPSLDWSKITTGKPTTFSGYGITDAASSTLTSTYLYVGNGSNVATGVAMSGDATLANNGAIALKNTGTAGTYTKVTTDAQGRVSSGTTLLAADVPNLDWSKITTGKPTTLAGYGITDGGGGGASPGWAGATVATAENRNSTSYGALATAGPAVTLTTGTTALVTVTALMTTANASKTCAMGFAISGVTTVAASDAQALMVRLTATSDTNRFSATFNVTGLTAGSNTFTAQYKDVTTANSCTFTDRNLAVVVTAPAPCSDATPNAFTFADQANASTSTLTTSDIVQLTGFNCAINTTVSGQGSPAYRICSDSSCSTVVQDWTNTGSQISSGQYMQVRQTSTAQGGATQSATVLAGISASVWGVATAGSCTSSPAVGTVCADGSVYAGNSPDTLVPMYVTRCDYGQTWSGAICNGSRMGVAWNNGTTNYIDEGYQSSTTGKANSAGLAAKADGASPHNAAKACEDLNEDGHTDWYLPAQNELDVLYTNRNSILNFDLTDTYWSSTEGTSSYAFAQSFSDGSQSARIKDDAYWVRCARR